MKLAIELILDELNQLSVDGIRDRFQKFGLKGQPVDPQRCVTARYLSDQLGSIPISLGTTDVGFTDLGSPEVRVSVPTNVRKFIRAFDRGDFPELVEENR